MIFVSAALVLAFLVALILPTVVCGKKSSGTVVSSAKKTDTNGIEKEEAAEESEDSDEPTHSEE
ncbi:MAG: hypothetical protein KAQ65_01195 [Candidatus Thorarchaeota archaeon]|nr:hypothetical protein [Candidatus Thorarchaeota archaeon]